MEMLLDWVEECRDDVDYHFIIPFIIQWEERQVGHANVNLDINIFVISELKWLKFGLHAHLFKVFGYAKFQLSIFFTLRVMKLLVEVFSDFH